MKKRLMMVIASFVFVASLSAAPVSEADNAAYTAYADSVYTINYPTQEQIINKYNQLGLDLNSRTTYTENFSTSAPYAMGDISDFDRQNALNALNFCRYIAGLPADVEILPEYNEFAQASSLVNATNNVLSHEPVQPAGMPADLYQMGYDGSSHSNIAMGYNNLADSIISGYMEDSDSYNIDRVGHRRWILYPELKYTGVGQVGRYSALYVIGDKKREGTFKGDYVAWPPPYMPMEIYNSYSGNYAFSVTLGNSYDAPDLAKVKVTVTSAKLGKTWNLDRGSTATTQYLNVNNEYYADPKCIIFNVGMFPEDDRVSVNITGITKGGAESPITYDVKFFSLATSHIHNYKISSIKAASCSATGVKTFICDECGDTYSESIPKTEHNYSNDWTIDKEPTCGAEGSKSRHCTVCDEKTDITPIERPPHKYTESLTKIATCETEGIISKICSVCNYATTEAIPKIEHTFTDEWITDALPTCIAEGSKSHHCSVCGEKKDVTALPKTEHLYSSKTTSDPSCTKDGVVTDTCAVCGDTKTSALPALGHTFGQYVVTVQPTADKEGSEQRTCTQCNTTETREIAKLSSDTSSSSTTESTSENNTSSDTSSEGNSGNTENSVTSSSASNAESSDNPTENSSQSGSDSTEESSNSSSTDIGNDSTTSDNPNASPVDFIKENLTVILLAFCSAAAVTIAVIIGILSKKKKK